jgi:MerR family transcriptional regulator, thiopeptide resistance regulator
LSGLYKTREFAELAGVTVRALHHYDRIGLLSPQRSSSSYRLYSLAHLERLEQITTLKFLGIPLKEIKTLLDSGALTLGESLDLQRRALTEKRDLITRAIHAIEAAEELVRLGQVTEAAVLRKIIEAIEMQPEENFMRRYYTEETWERRSQIMEEVPAETHERHREAWKQLFLQVESTLELDPASGTVQLLARQWVLLVEGALEEIRQSRPLPSRHGKITRTGPRPHRMRWSLALASMRAAIKRGRCGGWKKSASL